MSKEAPVYEFSEGRALEWFISCREFAQDPSRSDDLDLSQKFVENNIVFALRSVFGECGAATPFRVLRYSRRSGEILVSCPDHLAKKLRAALTLQGSYQGRECAYHVVGEGRTLLDLVL